MNAINSQRHDINYPNNTINQQNHGSYNYIFDLNVSQYVFAILRFHKQLLDLAKAKPGVKGKFNKLSQRQPDPPETAPSRPSTRRTCLGSTQRSRPQPRPLGWPEPSRDRAQLVRCEPSWHRPFILIESSIPMVFSHYHFIEAFMPHRQIKN